MRQNIKKHWLNHRHRYASAVTMVIFIAAGSLLNLYFIRQHIDRNFSRTFETFSYEGLETFHNGNVNQMTALYQNSQQAIINFALNDKVVSGLKSGNYVDISHLVDDYQQIETNFNTISVVDKNGIVKSIASDLAGIKKYIGLDLSSWDGVKQAVSTKKPFAANAYQPVTNRNVVNFYAPVTADLR